VEAQISSDEIEETTNGGSGMSDGKVVKYHEYCAEYGKGRLIKSAGVIHLDENRTVMVKWINKGKKKHQDAGYMVFLSTKREDGRTTILDFKISPECLVAMLQLAHEQGLQDKLKKYEDEYAKKGK